MLGVWCSDGFGALSSTKAGNIGTQVGAIGWHGLLKSNSCGVQCRVHAGGMKLVGGHYAGGVVMLFTYNT